MRKFRTIITKVSGQTIRYRAEIRWWGSLWMWSKAWESCLDLNDEDHKEAFLTIVAQPNAIIYHNL